MVPEREAAGQRHHGGRVQRLGTKIDTDKNLAPFAWRQTLYSMRIPAGDLTYFIEVRV